LFTLGESQREKINKSNKNINKINNATFWFETQAKTHSTYNNSLHNDFFK